MLKSTDTDNDLEMEMLKDLDTAGADEMIPATERKMDNSPRYQEERYQIWRCNGVPIGVRVHRQQP
jgi:hypothetical protein